MLANGQSHKAQRNYSPSSSETLDLECCPETIPEKPTPKLHYGNLLTINSRTVARFGQGSRLAISSTRETFKTLSHDFLFKNLVPDFGLRA